MRIRNHIRSNIIGYLALFFALTGSAVALDGSNTVFSDDIVNGEVKAADIATGGVGAADIATDAVGAPEIAADAVGGDEIANNAIRAQDVKNESLKADDLGIGSVGSSEVTDNSLLSADLGADSVGSSELGSGSVGADELRTPHEHFSPTTTITDTTAHDGAYGFASATVSCGTSEELLSVAIDWTDDNGHNERNLSGVPTINHSTNPQTATVEANFDGGGGAGDPASFQAVAICIF